MRKATRFKTILTTGGYKFMANFNKKGLDHGRSRRAKIIDIETKAEFEFEFDDLLTLCYNVGEQEERLRLFNEKRVEVVDLNYDVQFTLTDKEKKSKNVGRRITLPVEKVKLALWENEAKKLAANQWKEFKKFIKNNKPL